jgi:hypothetical protein
MLLIEKTLTRPSAMAPPIDSIRPKRSFSR